MREYKIKIDGIALAPDGVYANIQTVRELHKKLTAFLIKHE